MFSNELVCNIIEYLNDNINKDIRIDELSLLFHFDKTYIMKRFKKELGISVIEYINTIRIYNSLNYFKDDIYILGIALNNGFNSLEYFSETFKKIIGVSPTTYKNYLDHLNITDDELKKILDNISRISSIKFNTLDYLSHRKHNNDGYVKRIKFK